MTKSKKYKRKQRKSRKSKKSRKLRYKKGGGIGECPICFETKTLCRLIGCTHEICQDCYDTLSRSNLKCPICRANIIGLMCDGNIIRSTTANPRSYFGSLFTWAQPANQPANQSASRFEEEEDEIQAG